MNLTIIRGLPGSGKSTFAFGIQTHNTAIVEADMFHLINDKYVYKPEMAGYAHEWCQSQVAWNLNQGNNVLVANTFITKRTIVPYFELAQEFNAGFHIITRTGDFGNIHNVPAEVIQRMAGAFETFDIEDFIEYYEEYHSFPWAKGL